MTFKLIKDSISSIINLFDVEENSSGFIDESSGRMTAQEVLDIVLPIAKKAHFIHKSDSYSVDFKEIGLFSDVKNNKLIWIIHFEFLETNDESAGSYLDTVIASIKVEDATGEILSVWQKGAKEEVKYAEFLKRFDLDKE